jgi:hypothetical protein
MAADDNPAAPGPQASSCAMIDATGRTRRSSLSRSGHGSDGRRSYQELMKRSYNADLRKGTPGNAFRRHYKRLFPLAAALGQAVAAVAIGADLRRRDIGEDRLMLGRVDLFPGVTDPAG